MIDMRKLFDDARALALQLDARASVHDDIAPETMLRERLGAALSCMVIVACTELLGSPKGTVNHEGPSPDTVVLGALAAALINFATSVKPVGRSGKPPSNACAVASALQYLHAATIVRAAILKRQEGDSIPVDAGDDGRLRVTPFDFRDHLARPAP